MARLLLGLLLLASSTVPFLEGVVTAAELPQVRLLASNPVPFRGEELILTLEFRYQRRPPGILEAVWPALDRFAIEELPPTRPRREAAAGKAAEIIESQRLLVRPLAPGPVTLKGGGVRLADGRLLPAADLPLRIRPLPASGHPPDLSMVPGVVDLNLEAAGSGAREITILLQGNAWLQGFQTPTVTPPQGGRLTPLGESITGVPGGMRSRSFHYLFDPGPAPQALPAVDMTIFDPASGRYQQLHAGRPPQKSSSPAIAIGLLLLVGFGLIRHLLRRRRSLAILLQQLLGRSPQGLTAATIRQRLAACGATPATIELWEAWRQTEDKHQFAVAPPEDNKMLLLLRSRLRSALANDIDKRRGFPYLQRVLKRHFSTKEVMH